MNDYLKMSVDTSQTTTTKTKIVLNKEFLIDAVKQSLDLTIPKDAIVNVDFEVPGGGDWSNQVIELDEFPENLTMTIEFSSTEETST